ncbi:hypothetical protein BDW59DRAFT_181306 [Aspergillus cavernicola]|uniref:Uncharacterized protein n=1 Tax=Aspergillus cavernicola TaxID=176166 RepID=A0ABR4HZN5_9EURO
MSSSTTHPKNQIPSKTLTLYRRCFKGRKQLFSPASASASTYAESPATYFITNPTPHKHSNTWTPIFYRGDNPKYTPSTRAIGRARRSGMWGSFCVWVGDGVQTVLENEERRRERRKMERRNRWRRWLGRREVRAIEVEGEGEKEVEGKVVMVRMRREGGLSRSRRRVEWEVEGVRYRWSGTRMFARGVMGGVKGWSHSMKLIRVSDHALIATFEKGVLGSLRSIKTGGPPNKSKRIVGNLTIYDRSNGSLSSSVHTHRDKHAGTVTDVDAANTQRSDLRDEQDLNPDGFHSGNLTEDAIVFTCWIVVEAEHRLRYKILDFLEEVGENIDGG